MPSYQDSAAFRNTRSDLVQAVRDGDDLPDEEWARLRKLATPQQRRTADLIVDPTLAPHGDPSTYTNWGCRCIPCRTAYGASTRKTSATKDFEDDTPAPADDGVPQQIRNLQQLVKLGTPLTPKGQQMLDDWEAQQVL